MEANRVQIPFGDFHLAARLHQAAGQSRATAVIAHGLFSSMQSRKLTDLAKALAQRGISALQYDAAGCGESPGDISQTTVTGRRDELLAAAWYLLRLQPDSPLIYLGSSLGGTAALLAADLNAPACLVLWSAPTDLEELFISMRNNPEAAKLSALARDISRHDLQSVLARTTRVLFVHGENDQVVPVGQAREGHRLAREPKELVILPGADHRFTDLADQAEAGRSTLQWIGRFV